MNHDASVCTRRYRDVVRGRRLPHCCGVEQCCEAKEARTIPNPPLVSAEAWSWKGLCDHESGATFAAPRSIVEHAPACSL